MRMLRTNEFEDGMNDFVEKSAEELYEEFLSKKRSTDDGYVSYFGEYVDVMRGLSGSAKDLLTWMAFNSEMNTGRIYLQSFVQKEALKRLGITVVTYYRALNELKGAGIVKGGDARYYLNPRIVWKGTSEMRNGFMKVFPKMR